MKKIDISTPKYPNMFALVDDADYEFLNQWKWWAYKKGYTFYALRSQSNPTKKIRMHRQILGLTDPAIRSDHINRNGLDNQRSNLRSCTQGENMRNTGMSKNNKSGYKGVCWCKTGRKWKAEISVNSKTVFLGYYTCLVKAAKAYDTAAIKHYRDFANTNFPMEVNL